MSTLLEFALARYQHADIAAYCLRLQDNAKADVNMLLTAAWLAEQRYRWQPTLVRELIALCENWQTHCVLPLRSVRRYLKDCAETQALYPQIKKLELEAELQQLRLLEGSLLQMTFDVSEESSVKILSANLEVYFECIPPIVPTSAEADIRALIDALAR